MSDPTHPTGFSEPLRTKGIDQGGELGVGGRGVSRRVPEEGSTDGRKNLEMRMWKEST